MIYYCMHLGIAWLYVILGALSGALIGLNFQRQEWLGGYGSFRRRMLRLGHISFFGFAILNVMFGVTIELLGDRLLIASLALLAATLMMPVLCYLTAWIERARLFFALPVAALCVCAALTLYGALNRIIGAM
ncbi:MAG: hypothetical protein J5J00_05430 [Deltaproteobacteria bacterium]|nr:hypothetical protein [Deltaproteobacteria bacterium]